VGEAVQHWAIHPGGRSILDKVQERLHLSDAQLHPAREVLRENGNMSSATVLFVLKRILEDEGPSAGDRVSAMAFGPGLTAESALSHHDIARSRPAHVLFAAATWSISGTLLADSFIREDGLISIRRSYTVAELAAIAPAGWTARGGVPSRLELRWESDHA